MMLIGAVMMAGTSALRTASLPFTQCRQTRQPTASARPKASTVDIAATPISSCWSGSISRRLAGQTAHTAGSAVSEKMTRANAVASHTA